MSTIVMWAGPTQLTYISKKGEPDVREQRIRTNSFYGYMTDVLQVGRRLTMMGESIDLEGDCRVVKTSTVSEITEIDPYTYLFSTENSTYRLDFLPETDPDAAN